MNRRHLMQSAIAATIAGSVSTAAADEAGPMATGTVSKPRRLKRGDTVGVVAPASSAPEDEDIRFSIDIVKSLGFKVKQGKHLFARNQYLAGSDEQRADDVNVMFADDKVKAVICLRGGYGTPRMLPFLDYELIARNPKVLIGYSDITGILTAVHAKTGMVTYHGPVARQFYSDYTLSEYKKVMMNPARQLQIGAAPPFETGEGQLERKNRITYISGGKARGRLIGGNLTLIASLMGTEYEPNFEGRILFLEDVNEAPYRLDRMLTQLRLANKLQQVAGIALGKFTDAETTGNTFSIEEVMRDRCGDLGVPVIRGLMIGHVADQTTVPIGIEAELDGDKGTLRLVEAAVS